MKRNQSGFTLIEIAIVLVIIGLLLGGVLKGQELINSAKVKNLAGDFKNIPVFIYGYQDKYKSLPGDDSAAVTHVGAPAGSIGNGNGVIEGLWKPALATDESAIFWQHVRLAGLAPGETTVSIAAGNTYIPKNAVGGDIGITSAANSPITGLKGTYIVCSNAIAGKFAKQLDTTLDDGVTTTGSLQVVAVNTTVAVAAHTVTSAEDDTTFLVCMGF
ncbi:MAG: prepilin-type N-terminal cleavage/methylation domain-containing protein [Gallionella sp.]|nr:prepilin-type N-terminal cleavage/methylation domain-containing protein [Gallionella sp.]